jgi:hypothetical protein
VIKIKALSQGTKANLGGATGFLCKFKKEFYLVTNKHVVTGKNTNTGSIIHSSKAIPGFIEFTVPRIVQNSIEPSKLDIKDNIIVTQDLYHKSSEDDFAIPAWESHPSNSRIDVAIIRLNKLFDEETWKEYQIPHINFDSPSIFVSENLSVMHTVFVVGYPLNPTLCPNRFPIYKGATIASEPMVFENDPYILIDGKTKKGMSGSPVFRKKRDTVRIENSQIIQSFDAYGFLGVYSGRDHNDPELTTAELGVVWPFDLCVLPIFKALTSNVS